MTNLPDCQELQRRLRDYEDELHRLQSDMRDANNEQVRLERELPRERSRLLTLQAAEVALNGLPVERTALQIVRELSAATLIEATRCQQSLVDEKEQRLRQVIRTKEQGREKARELQYNIDRTMFDMRSSSC